MIIGVSGLFYGLMFTPVLIVAFGFLVNLFERGYTSLAYAYSPELFDTDARSLGTGTRSTVERRGPVGHHLDLHLVRLSLGVLLHRRHLVRRSAGPRLLRAANAGARDRLTAGQRTAERARDTTVTSTPPPKASTTLPTIGRST